MSSTIVLIVTVNPVSSERDGSRCATCLQRYDLFGKRQTGVGRGRQLAPGELRERKPKDSVRSSSTRHPCRSTVWFSGRRCCGGGGLGRLVVRRGQKSARMLLRCAAEPFRAILRFDLTSALMDRNQDRLSSKLPCAFSAATPKRPASSSFFVLVVRFNFRSSRPLLGTGGAREVWGMAGVSRTTSDPCRRYGTPGRARASPGPAGQGTN